MEEGAVEKKIISGRCLFFGRLKSTLLGCPLVTFPELAGGASLGRSHAASVVKRTVIKA